MEFTAEFLTVTAAMLVTWRGPRSLALTSFAAVLLALVANYLQHASPSEAAIIIIIRWPWLVLSWPVSYSRPSCCSTVGSNQTVTPPVANAFTRVRARRCGCDRRDRAECGFDAAILECGYRSKAGLTGRARISPATAG